MSEMCKKEVAKDIVANVLVAVTVTITSCDPVENGCSLPYAVLQLLELFDSQKSLKALKNLNLK